MKQILIYLVPVLLLLSCKSGKQQEAVAIPADMPPEIARITKLILADSSKPDLYYERAKAYLDLKDGNKALVDIFKAIKLKPEESKYYVAQGDAYLLVGNARQCKSALEQAVQLDSKNTEAYLKLAELALYFKDYEQVLMQLQKAGDIDPGNAKAWFIRGFALKEKGDTLNSIKGFQKAIDLKQDYFDAYIQLGMLYTVKKNRLALDYLTNAANLRPESIEPLYFKGLYYQETEQLNEAMAEYHKLLKLDPSNKFANFNLGYIHFFYLKVFGEAIKYFSRAIELDPAYVEAWYNRGYSYELSGDVNRARADYNKALELKPGYPLPQAGLKRLEAADKGLPQPR